MKMKEKIKLEAASLFAEHGYAGTSLAQISERVGIKKPSLYAHYKSKDHLFEVLAEEAFEAEQQRIATTEDLYELLSSMLHLYEQDARFRFLVTSSFFSPDFLKKEIMAEYDVLLQSLEGKIYGFERIPEHQKEDAAVMYTLIFDSIAVELCYGTKKRSEKRLDTAWRVFTHYFLKEQEKK